jgi:hypothetical protein
MADALERRLVHPRAEADRKGLACLLRLRSEGHSLDEIAAGLRAETGLVLPPETVDRVLRQVAGPVPRAEGGDPEYFTGYLGGG